MATTGYGSPYVQSSDLVSGWPATSLSVADRIDDVSFKGNGVNNQTAAYTTVLTDAGKTIVMNVGSANDLTIQASGTAAYETGTMIRIVNKGSGATTVKPAGGVTLNGGNITLAQNQSATVVNVATDIWSPITTPSVAAASGLTLVTTSTFSSVSSVSINNCFSSTYANYRIMIDLNSNSSVAEMRLRMRVSGSDSTASNYTTQQIRGADTSISGTRFPDTSFYPGYCTYSSTNIDIYSPFATGYTQFEAQNTLSTAVSTSAIQYWISGGFYAATTSFDGFTVYPNAGSFTGTIRVYGYQNS